MFATRGSEFNCPSCNRPFGGPPELLFGPNESFVRRTCPSCQKTIRLMRCLDDDKFAVFDLVVKAETILSGPQTTRPTTI